MLKPLEEVIILGVRADPEPVDMVSFAQPQRAIADSHAYRIDRLSPTRLN